MEKIGVIIKNLRDEHGISADELAHRLGRTGENRKQFIYDLEKGRIKRIKIETIKKLSEIFQVPMEDFITFNKDEIKGISNLTVPEKNQNVLFWEKKYLEAIEENSKLKSTIIELMGKISQHKND